MKSFFNPLPLLSLLLISGCASLSELTSVVTEVARQQEIITNEQAGSINRMNKSVAKSFEDITPEQEYYIGRAVAANILTSYRRNPHPAMSSYLNELGKTLSLFSQQPETFRGYHFGIFNANEINAFAAPGGTILISSELIRLCQSEEELAAVLAHEIAHVEQKHGLKAIKTGRLTSAFTILASETGNLATGGQMTELTQTFEESVGDITDTLVNNGYSRSYEFAADKRAADILNRAGYNPRGLLLMLQRMSTRLGTNAGGFGKTHPKPTDRIKAIQTYIANSQAARRGEAIRRARFQREIAAFR